MSTQPNSSQQLPSPHKIRLGAEHADIFCSIAWKDQAAHDRLKQLEVEISGGRSQERHGGKLVTRAISLWRYGTPGMHAMWRLNEIGRVLLNRPRYEREIKALLGIDGSSYNRLARAPFSLIQDLIPAPGGPDYYRHAYEYFADTLSFLLPPALGNAGLPISDELLSAVGKLELSQERELDDDEVGYVPLDCAVYAIFERVQEDEPIDAAMIVDLAIGATVDHPAEFGRLEDGTLLVLRWGSDLNHDQLRRAFEHKLRYHYRLGLVSYADYATGITLTLVPVLPEELHSHTSQLEWLADRQVTVQVMPDSMPRLTSCYTPVTNAPRARSTVSLDMIAPVAPGVFKPGHRTDIKKDRSGNNQARNGNRKNGSQKNTRRNTTPASTGPMTGTVTFVHADKPFGFITGDDGASYYARHCPALQKGARVNFTAGSNDKGPQAADITSSPARQSDESHGA